MRTSYVQYCTDCIYIWPEELRPLDQIFVQRTKWRQSTWRPRSVGDVILGEKWSEAWRIACLRLCGTGEAFRRAEKSWGSRHSFNDWTGRRKKIPYCVVYWVAGWVDADSLFPAQYISKESAQQITSESGKEEGCLSGLQVCAAV